MWYFSTAAPWSPPSLSLPTQNLPVSDVVCKLMYEVFQPGNKRHKIFMVLNRQGLLFKDFRQILRGVGIMVSQNFLGSRYEFIPPSRGVLGHHTLEIYKDLTSRVTMYIAIATSIIQRISENYKWKIYFLENSACKRGGGHLTEWWFIFSWDMPADQCQKSGQC